MDANIAFYPVELVRGSPLRSKFWTVPEAAKGWDITYAAAYMYMRRHPDICVYVYLDGVRRLCVLANTPLVRCTGGNPGFRDPAYQMELGRRSAAKRAQRRASYQLPFDPDF